MDTPPYFNDKLTLNLHLEDFQAKTARNFALAISAALLKAIQDKDLLETRKGQDLSNRYFKHLDTLSNSFAEHKQVEERYGIDELASYIKIFDTYTNTEDFYGIAEEMAEKPITIRFTIGKKLNDEEINTIKAPFEPTGITITKPKDDTNKTILEVTKEAL